MSIPFLTQSQRDDFEMKLKESLENSQLLRHELMEVKEKSEQLLQKSELTECELKEVKVKMQVWLHVHTSVAACTYKCGCMYMHVECFHLLNCMYMGFIVYDKTESPYINVILCGQCCSKCIKPKAL